MIRAYDPQTLERKWEYRMADITWGGVLATAGNLVFGGGKEGYFVALDATSGKELWRMAVGGQVNAAPMSYSVGGKQYIAVTAGFGGMLADEYAPNFGGVYKSMPRDDGALVVFSLK